MDLANRAPEWSDLEEGRVQHLCSGCLLCLTMSLRQRLRATLALQPASEKREKALVEELEKAKREMDELNEKIMATENEKV